jgi:hypothetical protein
MQEMIVAEDYEISLEPLEWQQPPDETFHAKDPEPGEASTGDEGMEQDEIIQSSSHLKPDEGGNLPGVESESLQTVRGLESYAACETTEIRERVQLLLSKGMASKEEAINEATAMICQILEKMGNHKNADQSATCAYLVHQGEVAHYLKSQVKHGKFKETLKGVIKNYKIRRIQDSMVLARCEGVCDLAGLGPELILKVVRAARNLSEDKEVPISIPGVLRERGVCWLPETPIHELKKYVHDVVEKMKREASNANQSKPKPTSSKKIEDDSSLPQKMNSLQELARNVAETLKISKQSLRKDERTEIKKALDDVIDILTVVDIDFK